MKTHIKQNTLLEAKKDIVTLNNINRDTLSEKEQIIKAMKIVEAIKKGTMKVYPIDTLWNKI
jgi:hypothetical protein